MSVVVSSGTYPEDVSPAHSGVQGSPISFAPAAGATVTVSGQAEGFAVTGQSWITISGFNIINTSGDGILLSSDAHITIDGNHVSFSGLPASGKTASGIYLSGTTDSLIENNTVDHNTDAGIGVFSGSARAEVRHNLVFSNAQGWQRAAQGIDVESASVTVDWNIVHDNEDTGLQFYPGADFGVAFGNVSYNNGDHGIDDLDVTGGALIGNTVYHNCADGINVEGTSNHYTVMNNISIDNAVYPAYNGIACNRRTGNIGIYDSAPATTTMDYNMVNLTATGDLYVWAGNSYSSPAALFAATGQEAHGIKADPKWINSGIANFRLQAGSPAIDSANSGALSEPAADADGNPRVDDPSTPNTGAGPRAYDDRGAYEFQTIDVQPPSVPAGLAGSAPNQSQVTLTWNPSSDNVGVAGYTVYRNGTQIAMVTSPGYTDGSVVPSTIYTYTVDAFDFANNHSAQSSPVSVTTPGADTQAPSVPTGLSVSAVTATSVSLAWNASTDNVGVTGYTVYRNGVAAGTSATTSFSNTGLAPSTSYTYKVDAFDAVGNHSSQSTAVTPTTLPKPAAYVQSGSVSTSSRVRTTTIALKRPIGGGDLLTGLFGQQDAAGLVQVSDNVNGPWTRAQGMTYSTGKGDIALYYLANSKASGNGLTVTISASASTVLRGTVGEYSGISTSAPLDQVALRSGSGLAVDSGATAPVAAGEMVFGAVTASNNLGTITGGLSEGLTFAMRSTKNTSADADILQSNAGTQDARFNLTNSVTWYALAAVFKPVAAVVDSSPPNTPTGIAAVNGTGRVSLSWNASSDNIGVAGYTVYRSGSTLGTVPGATFAYIDGTVAAATTYSYTVDAFDAAGNHSAPSAGVGDTTLDWVAPSVPAGLTATAASPTQVTIGWSASTDNVGVAGYTVYRNGSALATVGAATLAYFDLSTAPSTSYAYTVDAFDAAGNHSAQSAPAAVTTPAVPDTTPPSTPAGLAAVNGTGSVSLSWNASSDDVGVAGYTVYRNGSALGTVSGTTLAYIDGTVAAATPYSYAVDAFDAAGNHSSPSAGVGDTTLDWVTPSVPGSPSAAATAPTQVNLGWSASTDNVGVAGYTVYRNGSQLAIVDASTLSYSDLTTAPSTSYSYTVDAFDVAGNHSAQSASASVTTPAQPDTSPPTTPAGLTAQALSGTQVNLSWNASTDDVGVSGYTVYRNGSQLATVSGSTLTYSDLSVAPSTSYAYTVDAFDAAGNHSAPSAPAAVTTPAGDTAAPTTPSGLGASVSGPTQVSLAWSASTDNVGVAGYTVYRNGSVLATVGGSTLTYTDNAVVSATNYSYTVDAFDAAGNHSAPASPAAVHVPAQIRFVQGKAFTTGSRVTSVTVTLGAVSQGDLLVGWFGEFDSTGQVHVSDNVNGAWTRSSASTTWSGSSGDIALYYFANAAAAPSGITITVIVTNATYLQGAPAEYAGVATVNPLDQVSISKGTGTSADSGLTPATGAGELVYGGMTSTNGAGTLTASASQGVSFVKRAQSTSGSEGFEDVVTSAAGQQHAGFTFPNSVAWFMVCAVFKPA